VISKPQASGSGLHSAWTKKQSSFTINAKHSKLCQDGRLKVSIVPEGSGDTASAPLAAKIKDNSDGTYSVDYTPDMGGDHLIAIQYQEQDIPQSPFRADVKQSPNAGHCTVESNHLVPDKSKDTAGKEHAICGQPLAFTVDTEKAGVGELTVTAKHEDGEEVDVLVEARKKKPHRVFLPNVAKAGKHRVDVLWDGKHVPQSPFTFIAEHAFSAKDIMVRLA